MGFTEQGDVGHLPDCVAKRAWSMPEFGRDADRVLLDKRRRDSSRPAAGARETSRARNDNKKKEMTDYTGRASLGHDNLKPAKDCALKQLLRIAQLGMFFRQVIGHLCRLNPLRMRLLARHADDSFPELPRRSGHQLLCVLLSHKALQFRSSIQRFPRKAEQGQRHGSHFVVSTGTKRSKRIEAGHQAFCDVRHIAG